MPPKVFLSQMFCTTGLVSSKQVAQMYEEEIHFWKLILKHSETVLAHLISMTFATQDGWVDQD